MIGSALRIYWSTKITPHELLMDLKPKPWNLCRSTDLSLRRWSTLCSSTFISSSRQPLIQSPLIHNHMSFRFFVWETGYFNTIDITLDRWCCLCSFVYPSMFFHHPYCPLYDIPIFFSKLWNRTNMIFQGRLLHLLGMSHMGPSNSPHSLKGWSWIMQMNDWISYCHILRFSTPSPPSSSLPTLPLSLTELLLVSNSLCLASPPQDYMTFSSLIHLLWFMIGSHFWL